VLQTFFMVILPQAVPALIAVTMFHFFFCWNDFFEPLVFLSGHPEKFPITIGLTQFNRIFTQRVDLIQATSMMSLAIPVIIFFFAQRFFMQGVVITGVEK
jgi:multiple sugar transport system permease protein